MRTRAARLIGALGQGADAAGWQPGPVSSWVRGHKRPLEIGLVAAGALSLTFWSRPSAGDVVIMALVVLVGVGVVELVARPAAHAGSSSVELMDAPAAPTGATAVVPAQAPAPSADNLTPVAPPAPR
jgi:hypothetical protein